MDKMRALHYDLCVVGGGINGAGIARDAAGRGLSVLLVEAEDLAGATSSASSKLIHGGLRYLENYKFKMVREALRERETLLNIAPNIVYPAKCILLQDESQRPKWLVRLGLWLYDNIGGKSSLPRTKVVDLGEDGLYAAPLSDNIKHALVYSDCVVDDTRLVIANIVDAAGRGAKILPYTICDHLSISDGLWCVSLRDVRCGDTIKISASMVVNATGPWVAKFLDNMGVGDSDPDLPKVRLVKGSHIILPRQYKGEHIYVLQQPDKRIVFVMPYQGEYTLVGTTEEDYEGDPRDVRISDMEMTYLCEAVNNAFSKKITPSDALFTFSGVRPLLDDGKENSSLVTREYMIYHHKRFDPPLLSVFGGKLTTYRALGERVVDMLMQLSGRTDMDGWSAKEALAGGDLGGKSFDEFLSAQRLTYPWLPADLLHRYACSYGDRMDFFLSGTEKIDDLGTHYGDNVFAAEIDYLVKYEFASGVEDIIWRRSKLGLHISDETVRNIEAAL